MFMGVGCPLGGDLLSYHGGDGSLWSMDIVDWEKCTLPWPKSLGARRDSEVYLHVAGRIGLFEDAGQTKETTGGGVVQDQH